MRLPALLAVSLVSLPALVAVPAQAALVQYAYTATVSKIAEIPGGTETVNWLDSSTLAGPTISVGNTWTGTFFYDTDLALHTYQPDPEEHGSYQMYTGAIGSTITDAQTGLSFSSDPALSWLSRLSVRDSPAGAGSDFVSFDSYRSGADFEASGFWFHDLSGNALANSAVPSGLALGDFQFARVDYRFLQDGTNNWMSAEADITSLTQVTAPVPEPSTYAMLGLGLAALAMAKKLRRA